MAAGNTATMTVDGSMGAGVAFQAKVFSNVVSFSVDVVTSMLTMVDTESKVLKVALGVALTMTVTIAAGNYTVTIAD